MFLKHKYGNFAAQSEEEDKKKNCIIKNMTVMKDISIKLHQRLCTSEDSGQKKFCYNSPLIKKKLIKYERDGTCEGF